MKQGNYFLLLLYMVLGILPGVLHAQYENVWAFGYGAGLDFNSGATVAIKTSMDTREGCASLCDEQGQLLFYTDGEYVWARDHSRMPNTTNLSGLGTNITSSTTQGAIIVPIPGNPSKYYVFSLGALGTAHLGKLFYSVIDMDLNNGLGDLSPGTRGNLLDINLTEQMTAVTGNNCDVWLLVVANTTGALKAFHIDAGGVNPTPVVSSAGMPGTGMLGSIEVSPDRSKVALGQGNMVLMDFDPETGTAKNPVELFRANNYYGLCFSPDGSKLYASNLASLQQFDLSSGDSVKMKASKSLVLNAPTSGIKRGPDGKVYTTGGGTTLNVILKPNLPAADCQLVRDAVALFPGTKHALGMTNTAAIIKERYIHRSFPDTLTCAGNQVLQITNTTADHFAWDDGSVGPSRTVDKPGVYWVSYQAASPCMLDYIVDTFTVAPYTNRKYYSTQNKKGRCSTDTIILEATTSLGEGYQWNDNNIGPRYLTNKSGVYWVNYTIEDLCQDYSDTFRVTYPEKEGEVSFTADTLICGKDVVIFRNTSSAFFTSFQWSFGDEDTSLLWAPKHTYSKAGNYRVILSGDIDGTCLDTAYLDITVDAPMEHLSFLKEPSFVCTGMKITMMPQVDTSAQQLSWNLGDGTWLHTGHENIEHAYEVSGTMLVGLKASFRICPDLSFKDTVIVIPLPKIDLGADQPLCPYSQALQLKNRSVNDLGSYTWKWSTGDTTSSISITHHGRYSLTLSNEWGCSHTEAVNVKKDCYIDIPNAFTPNGDGQNDYFFPRQLLSGNIAQFRMQIFDRWGQKVFETANPEGRGWDGNLNGGIKPPGVYVYSVYIVFKNSKEEHYTGNVTLLR